MEAQAHDRALIQSLLQQNEYLLKRLMAQGETDTCRGDELRTKRREDDRNDDPNQPRGSEPPSASKTLGGATTSQGESTPAATLSEKA